MVYLVLDAAEHAVLPALGFAMTWFVLPLTALTLLVIVARTFPGRTEERVA